MSLINYSLPPDAARAVDENLRAWESGDRVARIWAGDASIWTGADESKWLGWLPITGEQLAHEERFAASGRHTRVVRTPECSCRSPRDSGFRRDQASQPQGLFAGA